MHNKLFSSKNKHNMHIPSQFYFFFLVSLILHTLASPTLQRDTLLEFKNQFPVGASDPNALYLSSWNTSSDHCSWEGVTCHGNSGEIVSLVLSLIPLHGSLKSNSSLFKLQHLRKLSLTNCELIGEIPSSLRNLSLLINLDLSYNHLVGEIPASLGNLHQLTVLNLESNNLTGKIPSSLGNLSHLTNLELSNNYLVGEVPTSIGSLNQLKLLSLSSNNLSGNIPVSFANLKKLSYLDLFQNQFTSGDFPHILPNLTSLSTLDLGHNHFKSKLPSLFTIPSLEVVNLRENQFEGPLEFGETSFLKSLDLSHNNFYGSIPESISGLVNLFWLDLSNNSLIGTIPGSMSKLVSLCSLSLSYNKLEGQVPSFLWRLFWLNLSHNSFSSLQISVKVVISRFHYDLGSNSLGGLFPEWICNSTFLDYLDLSNNHLTGSIPICSTPSLTYMNLRNNKFTGALPDFCIHATELRSLDVSRNQLVGKLPKSLINCTNMRFLNLKENKIKDIFPSWLHSLKYLRVLMLGSNAFYGPIYSSSAYFGFPTLRVIDISHNNFSGMLPQDYFTSWFEMSSVQIDNAKLDEYKHIVTLDNPDSVYMGKLFYQDSMDMMHKGVYTEFSRIFLAYKAIDFSGNKFQGMIPKSIGMLKGLKFLNLSRNAFKGDIPSSLANITKLEGLDLSRNKLSGQIPNALGHLTFLAYLDLSHNILKGPVPRGTQIQRQKCSSFEDNLNLFGLEENCGQIHVASATSHQPEDFSSEPEEVLNWIAAAIAYGPGVFCGLVIGHIFTSHKNEWFMEKFGRNKPRGIKSVR